MGLRRVDKKSITTKERNLWLKSRGESLRPKLPSLQLAKEKMNILAKINLGRKWKPDKQYSDREKTFYADQAISKMKRVPGRSFDATMIEQDDLQGVQKYVSKRMRDYRAAVGRAAIGAKARKEYVAERKISFGPEISRRKRFHLPVAIQKIQRETKNKEQEEARKLWQQRQF